MTDRRVDTLRLRADDLRYLLALARTGGWSHVAQVHRGGLGTSEVVVQRRGVAGVWAADPVRGVEVARRVQTGSIGINAYLPDPTAPCGHAGPVHGIGREPGPEGLAAYQQIKSLYLDT